MLDRRRRERRGRLDPDADGQAQAQVVRQHRPGAADRLQQDQVPRHSQAKGWPRILLLNRPGASARRQRLLEDAPTRNHYDRDEYPPAVARVRGFHIRGINPRGWMADVAYVPSHENRSHGSTMGIKLKRLCNGQKSATSSTRPYGRSVRPGWLGRHPRMRCAG
jgi:hypothetical protein